MYISQIRIINYKSFKDSLPIKFGQGFNVIIGPNNVGKTSIIESLKLKNLDTVPHKSESVEVLDPNTKIEFDVVVSSKEILKDIMRQDNVIFLAYPLLQDHNEITKWIKEYLTREKITFQLKTVFKSAYSARTSPTDPSIVNSNYSYAIKATSDHQSYEFLGPGNQKSSENYFSLLSAFQDEKIYVFKAERLNLGSISHNDNPILNQDGSNLASALFHMMGNKRVRFDKYCELVKQIFPTITHISVAPKGGEVEVKITSTHSDREDLAFSLSQSGTGIGQVLAILYVAINQPSGIIAIDEPNSFLHPGAAKKLIEILREYPHQYIISTHSPELIIAAQPTTLHLVQWNNGVSTVRHLDSTKIDDLRLILSEVGVGLSEVFGADAILWVEGQTEQECFQKIISYHNGEVKLGVSIVPFRNPGDLDSSRITAEAIWDIHERLSTGNALMPPAIGFSFDREKRSESSIEDLKKRSKGKVSFLPRRLYENFLIHPEALSVLLTKESSLTINSEAIIRWIADHKNKYDAPKDWNGSFTDSEWLKVVNGAKLLKELFDHFTENTLEFKKTKHSYDLTTWLLENEPVSLSELTKYVVGLLPKD